MARKFETGSLPQALGKMEQEFAATRDHFFMTTVGENGWPYVQHRGGPAGFLHVLDERTLAFADFSGNRQYVRPDYVPGHIIELMCPSTLCGRQLRRTFCA